MQLIKFSVFCHRLFNLFIAQSKLKKSMVHWCVQTNNWKNLDTSGIKLKFWLLHLTVFSNFQSFQMKYTASCTSSVISFITFSQSVLFAVSLVRWPLTYSLFTREAASVAIKSPCYLFLMRGKTVRLFVTCKFNWPEPKDLQNFVKSRLSHFEGNAIRGKIHFLQDSCRKCIPCKILPNNGFLQGSCKYLARNALPGRILQEIFW